MENADKSLSLDTGLKIDELVLIKHLEKSEFLPNIKIVYNKIQDLLDSRIQAVFDNYTLHNTQHSFRIMEYMAKIINDVSSLDELEVVLLVYSALLHDVGMAVSEENIKLIKEDKLIFSEIKFSSMKKVMNNDENIALKEFVRKFHSSFSAKYIIETLKDDFNIIGLANQNFFNELASICESHTMNFDWIKTNLNQREIKGKHHFNSQYIACVLRLADILDIDSNRTPYSLYKSINPKGVSELEWKQHFIISNNEKIEFDKVTNQKKIVFHGTSENANVHRKLLSYIDWVKDELNGVMELVNKMPSQYNLLYDPSPEINIRPNGFTFSDYKMTLDYKAISSLLMGEKIYGNKTLGLRELIQNSLDACKVRQEIEVKNHQFGDDEYEPKVKVILDPDKNIVIVRDNGIGMSMDIIKNHFLNIGVSYYNSSDFNLRDYNYKPIGNFGIGFLSCFMLSNTVKVITRNYKSKHKYTIELEKNNEYTSLTQEDNFEFQGTEVILDYNIFMDVFANKTSSVQEFLNKYFLTDGVNLELIDKKLEEDFDIVNSIYIPNIENTIKIDLSAYLKDISGCAIVKRNKEYIIKIEDLDFEGELYFYNGEGIQKHNENSGLNLDDYIVENEITYMSIPIVEKDMEERFLNGMKFTNLDVDDVIDKLGKELRWISIIVKSELQEEIYSCTMDDEDDKIFEKLTLRELLKIGHSENCSTSIFKKVLNIYEGKKNELYLPFEVAETYIYSFMQKKRKELFVRNVLIQEFLFNLPYTASIFEIECLIVNLNSKAFIPDISRNNFDKISRDEINYIVGKAIHVGLLDNLELSSDEKFTLKNFIDFYYKKDTEFEK